ncbi:MAG: hypothetical protein LBE81_02885 [Azonexus sp.]|jgi:hypothetical protein|uniref:hypothetical protein n=1 Tax=Azonexus sp. TaxID=1872668 RepID=UPI0028310B3A|nr:hypothetical protein [Azonexus sp.]MDR0775566.1 hypothetical protein [Azonexus sp.]
MNIHFSDFNKHHQMGEHATHPIRQPSGALAALLLLAGTSLPRRRALPARPMTACSGASN